MRCALSAFGSGSTQAYPLRQQPLLAARRRQAGMQRARIGRTIGGNIPEKQRVALASLVARVDRGKGSLAALVIVVEIDEECDDALSLTSEIAHMTRRVLVEIIVMRTKLLAHLVLQHRSRLEAADGQARARSASRPP